MANREQQNNGKHGQGKKDKKGSKDVAATVQPRYQKPTKPKGPVPASYAPNNKSKIEAALQAAKDALNRARMSGEWDNLVQGILSVYSDVGKVLPDGNVKVFDFEVKIRDILGTPTTAVEGPDGTYTALDNIFEPAASTREKFWGNLVPGPIGDNQFRMICFLQEVLAAEIHIQRGVRRARILRERALASAASDTQEGYLKLVHSREVAVKPVLQESEIRDVKEFTPNNLGIFNFNDGKHSCHVKYASGKHGNSVSIIMIDPGHCLALIGAEVGTKLFAKCLARDVTVPEGAPNREVLIAFQAFLLASIDAATNTKQQAA